MSCFRKQFFCGNLISYDCDEKRKLYFLRFFNAHSSENFHGMHHAFNGMRRGVIDKWFKGGDVNILSVGGGPGADIHGVIKYLECEGKIRGGDLSINVVRLDIENKWDEMFNDVMEYFFPSIKFQTIHLDVNNGFDPIHGQKFNLVTASYLVSELGETECLKLAEEVGSVLINGGVLMINDRNENAVKKKIEFIFNGIRISPRSCCLSEWGGYLYPGDIADNVNPKLSMNSIFFIGEKG